MASVHSPFRTFIKPILFKLIGESGYAHFQAIGKIKDIEGKLVEEDELDLLPHVIKEDDETIDIGANYAYFTHRLANISTKGRVYAFEPIPFTYKVCKKIINKYGFQNVALYQKGVGSKNEQLEFSVPLVDFGAISAGQAHINGRNNELEGKEHHYKFNKAKTIVCDVVAIDSFLPDINNLSYVKIDIEGAELFALRGMVNTIKKWHPMMLVEINPFFLDGFGLTEQQMRDFFKPLNYHFYIYDKPKRKLLPYTAPNFVEKNYMMLHDSHLTKYAHLIEK